MKAAAAFALDKDGFFGSGLPMDSARTTRSVGYWRYVENAVAAKVKAALRWDAEARQPVVTYLRDLEATARAECDRRQTIQIISSGRRLLGDCSSVGPVDGPFAHSLGMEP